MAIEDNSDPQWCLKLTLTVLYSIGVALSIILLAQAVITLVAFSTINDDHTKSTDTDRKNKKAVLFLLIIVVLALNLLFDSIALFAIVKEQKYILAVFTAFQVLVCGHFLWVHYLSTAIGHVAALIFLALALSTKNYGRSMEASFFSVFILIVGIFVVASDLLNDTIALFAIVKKKEYILTIFTAFQVVFSGLYLWAGYQSAAIGHVVMAIILDFFTHTVSKRQRLR